MRESIKASAVNGEQVLTQVGPSASNADHSHHQHGGNRRQRRASAAIQKREFKALVKKLQRKAAKMKAKAQAAGADPAAVEAQSATFEQVVAALAPQAPATVPDEG